MSSPDSCDAAQGQGDRGPSASMAIQGPQEASQGTAAEMLSLSNLIQVVICKTRLAPRAQRQENLGSAVSSFQPLSTGGG